METLQAHLDAALRAPVPAIAYELSRLFARRHAGAFVLETSSTLSELDDYAKLGHCEIEDDPEVHTLANTMWSKDEAPLGYEYEIGLRRVRWKGHSFELLAVEYYVDSTTLARTMIAGSSREAVEGFFRDYKHWASEIRDEVLVFEEGYWDRNEELFAAVRSASLEQLILPESFKKQIVTDLERFFASKELYREMGVPWKRGALFVGPPGNGKTLAIKALATHLRVPVLYVKSFAGGHDPHRGVREVFRRARITPGCMLVMEDLDSLVTDENRSFFLNELDGFAQNDGLCIVATTNHPEALDPAIVERPSRFDRKYHFALPARPERETFVGRWFQGRNEAARPKPESVSKIAEDTDGFSFAYLKELCMSATMQWVQEPSAGAIDEALFAQCKLLRAQMSTRRVAGMIAPPSVHR
ncbi:MAG: ATP-binding protein [Polyangiales bacterium]